MPGMTSASSGVTFWQEMHLTVLKQHGFLYDVLLIFTGG